jgi:hypothetical protein
MLPVRCDPGHRSLRALQTMPLLRALWQKDPNELLHSRWFTQGEKHRPHHSDVVGMVDEPPY